MPHIPQQEGLKSGNGRSGIEQNGVEFSYAFAQQHPLVRRMGKIQGQAAPAVQRVRRAAGNAHMPVKSGRLHSGRCGHTEPEGGDLLARALPYILKMSRVFCLFVDKFAIFGYMPGDLWSAI